MLLNKWTREMIVGNAMADAFAKREAKIRADMLALTDAIYAEHMGPMLERIKGLPAGLIHHSDFLYVRFTGVRDASYTYLYFGTYVGALDGMRPLRHRGDKTARPWIGTCVQYGARHAYSKRHEKLCARISSLKEARAALERKLEAAVKVPRTVEQLLKQWPEAKGYLPQGAPAPAPVPMILGATLTAEIKKAKAAA